MRGLFTTDIALKKEANQTLRFIINLGQVQKAIQDYAHKALPAPTENYSNGAVPSQRNLFKTWKERYPLDQLLPKWEEDAYKVILTTPTAVKCEGYLVWYIC